MEVKRIGRAVEDEHGLEHQGRAPEKLHIDGQNGPRHLQQPPLERRLAGLGGDGTDQPHAKADDAADGGACYRQHHGQAGARGGRRCRTG